MKISILLPYKENFSEKKAGAVSLFVHDNYFVSKFKKNIDIYGNTDFQKKLNKNYINLKFKKNLFKSSSYEYIKSFLLSKNILLSNIIEVHNRPNYIKLLRTKYKGKIFLYFHNDPLSMNGSESIRERSYLINNVDKIIFNSEWSRSRFFIDIKNQATLIKHTHICFQSADKIKIDFKKKEKVISFIGKLNAAKGYDIFGKSILEILDKYQDWSAVVIGDEPREKMLFKHERLKLLGFKSNKYILSFLKKVSISVITSRWNEPFGRASLEAASRGAATIISNKGGLPETNKSALILKKLDSKNLFKNISELIDNNKKLLKYQKDSYKNFIFTHEYVSKIIDNIRLSVLPKKNVIKKNPIYKILHITNFNYRFNGRLHYNTGRRINNGFIRLGHNVLTISDRDIISQNKTLKDYKGITTLQKTILFNYENFKPDIVVLGHADAVNTETIEFLKKNSVKTCQWFLDPLTKFGPDYLKNKKRIIEKNNVVDATFLTTDPKSLNFSLNNSYYIPNPSDSSFEILNNYQNNCDNDLFFAMSHGVHRGALKIGKSDNREIFINKLLDNNQKIKFDIYGMNGVQPIWGDNFIKKISNSYMGLNLSRGKPIKYYSSDRLAQLMGNGLLTFINNETKLGDFFTNKEAVLYKNLDDLSYKINKYKKDLKDGKLIAKNGKKFYMKYFNSVNVAEFIINKTLDIKSQNKFLWEK